MAVQDSQGTIISIASEVIGQLRSFGFGLGQRSVRDRTTLAATTDREFALGLRDAGEVTLGLLLDTASEGLRDAVAAHTSGASSSFTCKFEQGTTDLTLTFTAFVMDINFSGEVDSDVNCEITLKKTGAVTGFPAPTP